ncbi:MAG: hypothetical protein ACOYM3_27585, partial [Terrimicrobiaceae bacterium]
GNGFINGCSSFKFSGVRLYSLRDKGSDPFDIGVEIYGIPYDILADWQDDKYEVSGKISGH